MRENTKWIMLLTALAFVALMVFEWGMDISGRSVAGVSGGEIGRVNGQSITYEEFNAAYRALYERQQAAMGGVPIGTAMGRQIETAAFEQVVMEKLIAQELRRRGIGVTDTEIRTAARTMPPQEMLYVEAFQTDGQFDMTKYQEYLASAPLTNPQLLRNLEAYYREMIPRQKLFFRTTAGMYLPDAELWRMWRLDHEEATVRYISVDPSRLIDDAAVSVSDAEIATYYRDHRDDFLRPARARVKYVHIERAPIAADSSAALERARALRAEILEGADFAEVARRESSDSATASEGGLFSITRGQTIQAFDEAAFSQPVGRVGEPVLTAFGYHIIRVDKREDDEAEVRHILVPIRLLPEREDAILELADSLDALAESMRLDSIGRLLGLEVHEADVVPGLTLVPGIAQADDGEFWVFEEAAVGDVSPVFETAAVFYAFELVELQEERLLTEAEAAETIGPVLRADKKLARAKDRVRDAIERLRAGETLEQVAQMLGTEVREAGPFTRSDFVEGLGRMNAAIGTAFGLDPGETSGVVEADRRLYIIHLVSRTEADREAWEVQKEAQRASLSGALIEQRWQQFVTALREDADVIDNRDAVLRAPPVT